MPPLTLEKLFISLRQYCNMVFMRIRFMLALLLLSSCTPSNEGHGEWQKAVAELDQTISRSPETAMLKEARLASLRSALAAATSTEDRYRCCGELFNEFYRYDLDSAFAYAHRKDSLASATGKQELMNEAKISLALRYLTSGLYHEALETVNEIDTLSAFSANRTAVYYQTLHSIYHGLALTSKDKALQDGFRAMEHRYQALSKAAMTEDMIDYYTVNAGIMIENGQAAEARDMLLRHLSHPGLTVSDQSILHYWIAKSYNAQGLTDDALEHFATSARYDLITPVKASRALVNTARLLQQKGQPAKAYSYITRAYEDATECDAIICLGEIADIMPVITAAYNDREQERTSWLIASIALLLTLVAASGLILLVSRKYHRQIRSINASLEDNVNKLKEANDIKDICLGRYLSLFSNQISSLERYRSSLRVTAKSHDISDILQALKSDDFIDGERKLLYKDFDETFLAAYPDFVERLNSLLRPDARIGGNLKPGRLNNELRIFALIRLGVNESSKIASFLKKSPSTVYNYRVKLRNAAVCGYGDFEKKLMEIGNPLPR